MLTRDQIRPDILARPCEKCSEPLEPEPSPFVLTFFRGSFIVLHDECSDFIQTATPGPREARP